MSQVPPPKLNEAPRTVRRPKLLVSVRDVAEAEAALAGGADWIDLKEPAAGPLGAVAVETARAVAVYVEVCTPLSAALGELIDWPGTKARRLLEVPGIGAVKLGLAGCAASLNWRAQWLEADAEIRAAEKSLVAVIYADWARASSPTPDEILDLAEQTACRHLLIDTFDKTSGNVFKRLDMSELRGILNCARDLGLLTVVAGGITRAQVSQLPEGSIEVVAVRGGVCRRGREGPIDRQLVADFRHSLLSQSCH